LTKINIKRRGLKINPNIKIKPISLKYEKEVGGVLPKKVDFIEGSVDDKEEAEKLINNGFDKVVVIKLEKDKVDKLGIDYDQYAKLVILHEYGKVKNLQILDQKENIIYNKNAEERSLIETVFGFKDLKDKGKFEIAEIKIDPDIKKEDIISKLSNFYGGEINNLELIKAYTTNKFLVSFYVKTFLSIFLKCKLDCGNPGGYKKPPFYSFSFINCS
jgi:hypothetical protein